MSASAASAFAPKAEPALKPDQPNHNIAPPKMTKGTLCGSTLAVSGAAPDILFSDVHRGIARRVVRNCGRAWASGSEVCGEAGVMDPERVWPGSTRRAPGTIEPSSLQSFEPEAPVLVET